MARFGTAPVPASVASMAGPGRGIVTGTPHLLPLLLTQLWSFCVKQCVNMSAPAAQPSAVKSH